MPVTWYHGHLIQLDLTTNRYALLRTDKSESAHCPERETLALHQNLRIPARLLPPPRQILDYALATRVAHRIRHRPLRDQFDVLRQCAAAAGSARRVAPAVVADLSTTYHYLRVCRWRQRKCLEDSVAGYLFFRRYTAAVQLVIGVSYPPFHAHAWLEAEDQLLNDCKVAVESLSEILRFAA